MFTVTTTRGMVVHPLRREQLDDLLPEWRALHARTPSMAPFTDPDLQVVWCDHFVPAGRELVLAVRLATTGELVAVLPFFAPFGGLTGRLVRYLRPFGGQLEALVHEMPEISADPGHVRGAIAAVIAWFGENDGWDFVELTLRDDQPWIEPRWMVEAGLDRSISLLKKAYPSIVLELPEGGGAPALKRNLKESLRRSRNRMKKEPGEWAFVRTPGTDPGWDAALADLVRLHVARAEMDDDAPKHTDLFSGTSQQGYLDALAGAGRPSCPVVHRLMLDGRCVAALLVFEYPDSTWISGSGCAPEQWHLGAVTALQWEAVQHAVATGRRQVVFSVGIDTTKLRWSETVRVRNGFLFSHSRPRSRRVFRAYWLLFQYRSSLVDVSPFASGSQRRLRGSRAVRQVADGRGERD